MTQHLGGAPHRDFVSIDVLRSAALGQIHFSDTTRSTLHIPNSSLLDSASRERE